MAYLWYSPSTRETGQKLANALGIEGGESPPNTESLIIGWGARDNGQSYNSRFINDIKAISNNRNKYNASLILIEEGISTPTVYDKETIKTYINDGWIPYPLIARPFNHQGGTGVNICPNNAAIRKYLKQKVYFTEYVPNSVEYRVHVFDGKVICMCEKYGGYHDWIRSSGNGWRFRDIHGARTWLKLLAIDSVKALGLDFGAVDIAVDDSHKAFVIEVNTAPALNDRRLKLYKAALQEKINAEIYYNNMQTLSGGDIVL